MDEFEGFGVLDCLEQMDLFLELSFVLFEGREFGEGEEFGSSQALFGVQNDHLFDKSGEFGRVFHW